MGGKWTIVQGELDRRATAYDFIHDKRTFVAKTRRLRHCRQSSRVNWIDQYLICVSTTVRRVGDQQQVSAWLADQRRRSRSARHEIAVAGGPEEIDGPNAIGTATIQISGFAKTFHAKWRPCIRHRYHLIGIHRDIGGVITLIDRVKTNQPISIRVGNSNRRAGTYLRGIGSCNGYPLELNSREWRTTYQRHRWVGTGQQPRRIQEQRWISQVFIDDDDRSIRTSCKCVQNDKLISPGIFYL